MLVKCKFCGKKIDREFAYKVVVSGKNNYYCDKLEYDEIAKRKYFKDQIYNCITELFGYKVTNTALFKEFTELCKNFGYELVCHYLYDNTKKLSEALNREFVHEYAKIRYFSAVIKNNIADYRDEEYRQKSYTPPVKYTQENVKSKFKATKQRRALADIEGEVG